jgi:hypothetical protein
MSFLTTESALFCNLQFFNNNSKRGGLQLLLNCSPQSSRLKILKLEKNEGFRT